jgi:hypothetical protein
MTARKDAADIKVAVFIKDTPLSSPGLDPG